MTEQADGFEEHVITDLHEILTRLQALEAELEEYRPMLRMFKPRANGGGTDLQKAGVARALWKGTRGGGRSTG